jgi:SgrR family transcriptional regulator
MHYELRLFQFFKPHTRQETSIEELAQIWQCSARYAKTIVQKLQQQNIIQWETSKGRGKKPFITLLQSKHDCIFTLFQHYWLKEQFERAYSLLAEYQMLHEPKIQAWLGQQFGVQQKANAEQIFRFPLPERNVTFNPLQAISNYDAHFIKQVHETLFKENEITGEIEGNLIFHYETKDLKSWRFILRKGIYFHHLKPVQAADVQYSLERLAEIAKPYFDFEKFEIIHDYELIVTLSKPFAILPNLLTSFRTVILPKDYPDGAIGCGPFMLEEQSNYRLQLKTFDHYFHTRPYVDGIEAFFNKNKTDFGISYTPYPKSTPQQAVFIKEIGANYVVFNSKAGSLQNPFMRETVYALIEATDFTDVEQYEVVATSWFPNQHTFKPRAELKCASASFPILTIGYQQIHPDVNLLNKAVILQKQLNKYGIPSRLQCIDLQQVHHLEDSIDLFIGSISIGKQKILSILNAYFSKPHAIFSMVDEQHKQLLLQKIETIYSGIQTRADEQMFHEIEQQLQTIHCLKFLTHQQYHLYIREDIHFQNVQFDDDGFIKYKKIFV